MVLNPLLYQDFTSLANHFSVKRLQYNNKKDIVKLAWNILKSDVNFSWFALGYVTTAVF